MSTAPFGDPLRILVLCTCSTERGFWKHFFFAQMFGLSLTWFIQFHQIPLKGRILLVATANA